jgi:hypothetical protein
MLPDPVSVAADSPIPAYTFTKLKQDGYGSEYVEASTGISVVINHSKNKAGGTRHYVQMTQPVDAADPYSGITRRQTASVSISISRPAFGFTDTVLAQLVKSLTNFVYDTEVTPAKLLQLQS